MSVSADLNQITGGVEEDTSLYLAIIRVALFVYYLLKFIKVLEMENCIS